VDALMEFSETAIGQRVQMHPATDLWMRGARYGWVTHQFAISGKVQVQLDGFSPRVVVLPKNLLPVA
jgi:hypothetical protein